MHRAPLLALALLAACSADDPAPAPRPSAVVSSFEALPACQAHRVDFEEVHGTWSRTGLLVTPPGHHFAHFSLTGTLDGAAREALLATLRDEASAHLAAAGGSWSGEWQDATGRADELVSQVLGPGREDVAGGYRAYAADGAQGWAEVLAARPADDPDAWTIGLGFHEADAP